MDANSQALRLGAAAMRYGLNTFMLVFAVGAAVLLYHAYAAPGDMCGVNFAEQQFRQSRAWIIATTISLAVAGALILLGAVLVLRSARGGAAIGS